MRMAIGGLACGLGLCLLVSSIAVQERGERECGTYLRYQRRRARSRSATETPDFHAGDARRQAESDAEQLSRQAAGGADLRFLHVTALPAPGWCPGSDVREVSRRRRVLRRLHSRGTSDRRLASSQNVREKILFEQPNALDDRQQVAEQMCSVLKLSLPTIIDSLDDKVNQAYAAWPDRLYLVGRDGKIAFKGHGSARFSTGGTGNGDQGDAETSPNSTMTYRFFVALLLTHWLAIAAPAERRRDYSIPLVDLADQQHRQVVVDRSRASTSVIRPPCCWKTARQCSASIPRVTARRRSCIKRSHDGGLHLERATARRRRTGPRRKKCRPSIASIDPRARNG